MNHSLEDMSFEKMKMTLRKALCGIRIAPDNQLKTSKVVMAKTKRWARKVKTISTQPPKDLFTKDAQTVATTMAKKA